MDLSAWREDALRWPLFQSLLTAGALTKYLYCSSRAVWDLAYDASLRHERLARTVPGWSPNRHLVAVNSRFADVSCSAARALVKSFVQSKRASAIAREFAKYGVEHQVRLRFPKKNDDAKRQGDLLLLKPYLGGAEKGVLFLQYNDAFERFVSLFDLDAVARHYRIVLEPSTWGYRDKSLLLFRAASTEVVVEAQHEDDYRYMESLGGNFVPLRMGAGDWIDPDRFAPGSGRKEYEVVMVGSWQRIKRHELLFRAVASCGDDVQRVALIGYRAGGRTQAHVRREAEAHGVAEKLVFFENISRDNVSQVVRSARVGVMLTVREGANKGIYECFFCDVPVLLSGRNIGVNRDDINSLTGVVADDSMLSEALKGMLRNLHSFEPRAWALRKTGYRVSTKRLNDTLAMCARRYGEPWTRSIFGKKNDTNAQFVLEEDRLAADRGTEHLRRCLRSAIAGRIR